MSVDFTFFRMQKKPPRRREQRDGERKEPQHTTSTGITTRVPFESINCYPKENHAVDNQQIGFNAGCLRRVFNLFVFHAPGVSQQFWLYGHLAIRLATRRGFRSDDEGTNEQR